MLRLREYQGNLLGRNPPSRSLLEEIHSFDPALFLDWNSEWGRWELRRRCRDGQDYTLTVLESGGNFVPPDQRIMKWIAHNSLRGQYYCRDRRQRNKAARDAAIRGNQRAAAEKWREFYGDAQRCPVSHPQTDWDNMKFGGGASGPRIGKRAPGFKTPTYSQPASEAKVVKPGA